MKTISTMTAGIAMTILFVSPWPVLIAAFAVFLDVVSQMLSE